MTEDLEFRLAAPDMTNAVVDLFATLAESGESSHFNPHPLNAESAESITNYNGKDFFAFAVFANKAIGYGLLRGWDEGYDVPSLGISIHPTYRGGGVGQALMHYLHSVAKLRGCNRVRLRVHRNNNRAKRLYERLGYRFSPDREPYLCGHCDLKQYATTPTVQTPIAG